MQLNSKKRFSPRLSMMGTILAASLLLSCGGEGGDATTTATPSAPSAPSEAASGGQAVSAQTSCGLANFQQTVMARINEARASSQLCGTQSFPAAAPLTWDEQLFAAAAGHAADMARNDYFAHDSRDGRTFSQRITDAGYAWSAVGENIAAGQADVAQVITAWMDSPGHCVNIMSTSFTEVAVACVRDDASTYTQYWAMSLGRPR